MMKTTRFGPLLLNSFLTTSSFVDSFVVTRNFVATSTSSRHLVKLFESNIPTLEQLSSDPFMKQVGYASEIVPLLKKTSSSDENNKNEAEITELLKAQLSHSDGIRGFFVMYLTGNQEEDDDDEGNDQIPKSLIDAMNTVESEELVSLACMNVIMPTAMTSMHEDEELAQSSAQTAKRGIRVLKVLMDKPGMKDQCQAIYDVAVGTHDVDDNESDCSSDYKYWTEFFEKWGYEEKQREDIKNTMADILQ